MDKKYKNDSSMKFQTIFKSYQHKQIYVIIILFHKKISKLREINF